MPYSTDGDRRRGGRSKIGPVPGFDAITRSDARSEEHTSELQSLRHLVCRLLLEKKNSYRWHIELAHTPDADHVSKIQDSSKADRASDHSREISLLTTDHDLPMYTDLPVLYQSS